ncbi:MAG: ABC transporter permease [Pseudonocardiales bacterium]|nr:ABC transporter permease [Pseudonocardiales bacterium]
MNWIGYTTAQFRLSQRVYWNRIGIALSGTLVPLGLGIFIPLQLSHAGQIDGTPAGLYALTGFLAFTLFFTVYNLVNAVTSRRDALIYKRLRTSPLPDTSIFAGEGAAAALPSIVVAVVLIGFGIVILHSGAPNNIPLLILGLLLGSVMFTMLAIGISGMLPRAETSMWIVTPVMVLFMLCSGIFAPLANLPGPLGEVAAYLPMSPLVSVLRTAYLGQDYASHDALLHAVAVGRHVDFLGAFRASLGALSIMVAWTAVSFALARKLFRWDPRRAD